MSLALSHLLGCLYDQLILTKSYEIMTVQNLHFPQSQRHHIHTAFAQDYRCSYPIVKDHKKTNKQKSEEKQKKVVGLSIFSSVQFWTKINNKTDFFLSF